MRYFKDVMSLPAFSCSVTFSAKVQKPKGKKRLTRHLSQPNLSSSTNSLAAVSLPDIPKVHQRMFGGLGERPASRKNSRAVPPPPTSQAIRPPDGDPDEGPEVLSRPQFFTGDAAPHAKGMPGKVPSSPVKLPQIVTGADKTWSHSSSIPTGPMDPSMALCRTELIDHDLARFSWEERLVR